MKTIKNNKTIYLLTSLSIAVALFFSSCTDGFEALNTNPLNPPYAEGTNPNPPVTPDVNEDINLNKEIPQSALEELKNNVASIGSIFKKFTYEGLVNDYQRTTNLTHDIYAGYFANNHPSFNNNSPNYIYTEDWSGRRWGHFYKSRTTEYQSLARTFFYVDKEKYHNAYYITRIYYAFLASTMTDTYGDMPFGELVQCKPKSEKMPFDTQEKVYDKIFRILTQAADSIKLGQAGFKFTPSDDKCFGGDEEKWVRFANTLRLRLALRISNIDPARAKKEGEAALAHAAGMMRSQEDRMRTVPNYAPVAMGGENEGGSENEVANDSFRYLDAVMSKDIELGYKNLSSNIDPRCGICWFRPTPMENLLRGKENPRKNFTGCEIGFTEVFRVSDDYSVLRVNAWEDKSVLRDDYWFGYSREYIWLGYAECKFLQAEAALRNWKGVNGTPEQLFKEGIRESMNYYHLSADKAEKYINELKIYTGTEPNPFATNNKEGILEQIIIQKWLAVFPNGNEGWAEFRRTDYPRLRNHLTNRDSDIPVGKFIKRVRYPFAEEATNGENMPKGVNQSTRLWWDVSDTNGAGGVRNTPNNFR